jgi:tRNA(Ile)-lysidine synthase TilS/MesJ
MKHEKYNREMLSHLRRADTDFGLIAKGDKIAVGLSGGKDSMLLLKMLAMYQKFNHSDFELVAITVDCTGGKADFSKLQEFCNDLGVEFIIQPSNIFEIIFDIRKEKNPCSLCSKLRRGILHTAAVENKCNKVALGHHGDDLVETFFLSLLYEGRLSTFSPTSYLDRTDITVIRPLVYASETEITALSKDFPILENPCPVNHHTQREYMKNLVKKLDKDIPEARKRMFDAITNAERYNLFPHKKQNNN